MTRSDLFRATALCLCLSATPPALAQTKTEDIQRVGIEPLYEALFAASNCPGLALDETRFAHQARLYRLSPEDFSATGPFAPVIAELTSHLTDLVSENRPGFCSTAAQHYAIFSGILRSVPR